MELQEKANNNIVRSLWRNELIYAMLTAWGQSPLTNCPAEVTSACKQPKNAIADRN